MIKITISNFKGGVGKTTIAYNVGYDLATRYNKKVLLVDFDPQCNLTDMFEVSENASSFMDYLQHGDDPLLQGIKKNIDLISGGLELEQFANFVTNSSKYKLAPGNQLKILLDKYEDKYDYCIIDTRPTIDLTVANGLAASNYVILPVQPTNRSLKGMDTSIELIKDIKNAINPNLCLLGIIINEFNSKNLSAGFATSELEAYNESIFETKIRKAEAVLYAENNTINIFAQNKNTEIKKDFQNLTDEIVSKIKILSKKK